MEKEELSHLLNIPGREVTLGEEFTFVQKYLNTYKTEMISEYGHGYGHEKRKEEQDFIGAQPISMRLTNVQKIAGSIKEQGKEDLETGELSYLICEKTDGVRYIMVITTTGECYLTGRNKAKSLENPYKLYSIKTQLSESLFNEDSDDQNFKVDMLEVFDGELVLDYVKGQYYLKFLIFDCMVHFGEKIYKDKYQNRLRSAQNFLQYNNMCFEINEKQQEPTSVPFKFSTAQSIIKRSQGEYENNLDEEEEEITISMQVKDFFKCKNIGYLFNNYIPALPHDNDGIVFTKNASFYKPGTDMNIIKWKPPQMNTIDFLLIENVDNIMEADGSKDFENRVIDLYVMVQNNDRNSYELSFFDFMIADEAFFQELSRTRQKREGKRVVAECKWIDISEEKKALLKKIYSSDSKTILTYPEIKQDFREQELQKCREWLDKSKKRYVKEGFSKGWQFYKFRLDKDNSNNIKIAKDIVDSIDECLDKDKLVQLINGQSAQQNNGIQHPPLDISRLEPQKLKKMKV